MLNLKSALFVFVTVHIALSYQKPIENESTKRVADNLQSNDGKMNNSGIAGMPMAVERTRTAAYPNSNGLGFYSLGQVQWPIQHYPAGMPYQAYQPPAANGMLFKNEESSHTDPRTLGLGHSMRPSLYSQYQSLPQVYSYPVQSIQVQPYHVQPYSYEYSSPLISGYGGHGSSYSSYPSFYRDAEEDKPRQFGNLMSSSNISPVRPGVQYTTKYLMGKPYDNYESFVQPQTMQPMLMRFAMPKEWSQVRSSELPRAVTIDDQLQMQIPQNYLIEKLQHYTPSNDAQQSTFAQPMMSRAAEEPKPFDWSQQMLLNQPTNFKSGDVNQQIQDPYVTPEDSVYIVPNEAGQTAHLQNSRSAELSMPAATFPNQEQQLRIAQMQAYHDAMNDAANHIEPLNREYVNQRMFQPNFQSLTSMNQLPPNRMFFDNNSALMGVRANEEQQINKVEILAKLQKLEADLEKYLPVDKTENRNSKDTTKAEIKKEQTVPEVQQTGVNSSASGSNKHQ